MWIKLQVLIAAGLPSDYGMPPAPPPATSTSNLAGHSIPEVGNQLGVEFKNDPFYKKNWFFSFSRTLFSARWPLAIIRTSRPVPRKWPRFLRLRPDSDLTRGKCLSPRTCPTPPRHAKPPNSKTNNSRPSPPVWYRSSGLIQLAKTTSAS